MLGRGYPVSARGKAVIAYTTATMALPYVYRWDRQGRKGQQCKVTARGKMNSIRVEFSDGYVMVTSGNAIRRTPATLAER